MRKPTILLVDDHVIFVEGLRRLLEPDFQTLRHVSLRAAAERVEVHVDRKDVEIGLTVVDFGRSFRLEGESRGQGFGLVGIEERVRMIGGEFSITSAEGQGTTLAIRVPLQEEKSK